MAGRPLRRARRQNPRTTTAGHYAADMAWVPATRPTAAERRNAEDLVAREGVSLIMPELDAVAVWASMPPGGLWNGQDVDAKLDRARASSLATGATRAEVAGAEKRGHATLKRRGVPADWRAR